MNIFIFCKLPKNGESFLFVRSCSTSYPSGNQVDGSPLVAIITRSAGSSPLEEVAQPARPRAAQNDEPTQNFIELSMFCIMDNIKSLRISFRAYIEDGYRGPKI